MALKFLLASALCAIGIASYADIAAAGPEVCPAGTNTSCAVGATCCPIFMSLTGYGCCHLPNAVCCGSQGCCPQGTACNVTGQYSANCIPTTGPVMPAVQVCTPGPLYAPNATALPSAIAIGDSVSIGYTPAVIALVNTSLFLQHSPYADGGGADDSGNGLNCINEFLRDSMYVYNGPYTVTSFNFGLHNLFNDSIDEERYSLQLTQIADAIVSTGTKPLFITTTPYMPAKYFGNLVVEQLNAIATSIMAAKGIPVADLYEHIIAKCGPVYANCSICDNEFNPATNLTCGYHYTPEGYAYIAEFLAPYYLQIAGVETDKRLRW